MLSSRYRQILHLGLPIIGGMLSQSLLNLVDTALVGALGGAALAGVGVGGYASFLVMALVMGLSSGVQAMVARRHGQGRLAVKAEPLNGGLLIALLFCLPLMLICLSQSDRLIALISDDRELMQVAVPYLDYRLLGAWAVGFNLSFRGYWNGINQSMAYLRVLVAVHLFNVVISYGLIYGAFGLPEMGAAGAGLGTTLSLYLGSLIYVVMTWRQARSRGFLTRLPDRQTLTSLLRLSIPNSLQQLVFASSVAVLFGIIAQLGTRELAIAHVLTHLSLLLILPAVGFGMAATTLVSHDLGKGDQDSANQWGWDTVRVAAVTVFLLSLPLWLLPTQILGLFLSEPPLIEQALIPLRITCVAICIDVMAIVFTQAMLGAGANRTVMMVTLLGQWGFFLPLTWLVGPVLGGGLTAIWLVQLLHRGLSSVILSFIWSRRRWSQIRL
ncbi:MATE family efflux transporter [Motiliproteus sp.]|uniref:MATE family efflux transporter n=1 Tax=Motiliproteus sp. TaxID=1898955 RepID=UPI003BA8D5D9